MDMLESLYRLVHKCTRRFDIIQPDPGFRPQMVQRPLIDAGNTGRYALDAFQLAFNSPAGGGTLTGATMRHTGIGSIDVTTHQAVTLAGMGTIPSVPGQQGLVQGFRNTTL